MNRWPLEQLESWWTEAFSSGPQVDITGGFRDRSAPGSLSLLQLSAPAAHTAWLQLSINPPTPSHSPASADLERCFFVDGDEDEYNWWLGWASVLTASVLLTPRLDPQGLASLLHETQPLRLCCDTQALASGVVHWLLWMLGPQTQVLIVPAIERELGRWTERRQDLWDVPTVESWRLRTQYRLAQSLLLEPPHGYELERAEDPAGQPHDLWAQLQKCRSSARRLVYVTADPSSARQASGVLGAQHVLWAQADWSLAKHVRNQVLPRGVWRPGGTLGALRVPPIRQLLSQLLCACDVLECQADSSRWQLRRVQSVLGGSPSDWAEPHVELLPLEQREMSVQQASATPLPTVPSRPLPLARPTQETPAAPVRAPEPSASEPPEWLLPPVELEPPVVAFAGWRPQVRQFATLLLEAFGAQVEVSSVEKSASEVTLAETRQLLGSLGAIQERGGGPGARVELFRQAWMQQDYDWLHAQLRRLPGYASALETVRKEPAIKLATRPVAQLSMARALGQVARLQRTGGGLCVGDAPLRTAELLQALERWLPEPGSLLALQEVCRKAITELGVTPLRLERALMRLWEAGLGTTFTVVAGDPGDPGSVEQVIVLGSLQLQFRPVAPGALLFGRSSPMRLLTRMG